MHKIIDKKFYLGTEFGLLINKRWITISELLHRAMAAPAATLPVPASATAGAKRKHMGTHVIPRVPLSLWWLTRH
jgi:hypothetical protein